MTMNILILNQHTNNFGDDAAGIALVYQVLDAFPDADIDMVYSWNAERNTIPVNHPRLTHHLDISLTLSVKELFKAMVQVIGRRLSARFLIKGAIGEIAKLARRSEIVFVSPCGANIGIYKDWLFLARIMIAVAEGVSPIFHLNTVGKSNSFIFNMLARFALRRSRVFVREKASLLYLRNLGIAAERGVDTAFSLPEAPPSVQGAALPANYLTFIPTEFSNWHVHYRQSNIDAEIMERVCTGIASFCRDEALKVVLLPHLNGSLRESELLVKYRDRLTSCGMEESSVVIAENVENVFHYEQYIRASELVLSMRYHGVIFAAKNSRPFISLSYENKMKEVCDYTGMSDCHVDIKEICSVDIHSFLERVYGDKEPIMGELSRRKPFLSYLSRLPVHAAWLEQNS